VVADAIEAAEATKCDGGSRLQQVKSPGMGEAPIKTIGGVGGLQISAPSVRPQIATGLFLAHNIAPQ
jgi:hypothetical protein